MFYWEVEFKDGFKFVQFDEEGKEQIIQNHVTKDCWIFKEKKKFLDTSKNFFQNFEKEHGKAIRVSWKPFTKQLITKILKHQKMKLQAVDGAVPITHEVPEDCFPIFWRATNVHYSLQDGKPVNGSGEVAELHIGYLPRSGSKTQGVHDTINLNLHTKVK